jgi:DivIVA domain-containing protein
MNKQTKHNATSIVNKAFHVDFKGYAPLEVDSFLDEIVSDYHLMEEALTKVEESNYQLRISNQKYQEKLVQLESQLQSQKEAPSNRDLLQRLARLEALIDQKD